MHVNRPFPHYGPVNKHKEMRTRLGWTISYKSLYFVHPSLELMPLFTEMRERSIEKETFFFLNISWDPKFPLLIVLIERFARKFGHQTARQNTGQGCKKRTFGCRASGSKRLLSSLLKCWIISTCRTLYLHYSFSLDLPNLRQGQGSWICNIPSTSVFIHP